MRQHRFHDIVDMTHLRHVFERNPFHKRGSNCMADRSHHTDQRCSEQFSFTKALLRMVRARMRSEGEYGLIVYGSPLQFLPPWSRCVIILLLVFSMCHMHFSLSISSRALICEDNCNQTLHFSKGWQRTSFILSLRVCWKISLIRRTRIPIP